MGLQMIAVELLSVCKGLTMLRVPWLNCYALICFRRHNPNPTKPDAKRSIVEGSGLATVGCCPPVGPVTLVVVPPPPVPMGEGAELLTA